MYRKCVGGSASKDPPPFSEAGAEPIYHILRLVAKDNHRLLKEPLVMYEEYNKYERKLVEVLGVKSEAEIGWLFMENRNKCEQ